MIGGTIDGILKFKPKTQKHQPKQEWWREDSVFHNVRHFEYLIIMIFTYDKDEFSQLYKRSFCVNSGGVAWTE